MQSVLVSFAVVQMLGLLALLTALSRARDGSEDSHGFHRVEVAPEPQREPVVIGR